MNFRNATINDLDQIMVIINDAKLLLKKRGGYQWNDISGYPNETDFTTDIKNNNLFVLVDGNKILGLETLIIGNEKNYDSIEGKWLTNSTYLTIHRIAISKEYYHKHISKLLIAKAIEYTKTKKIDSIRVDTHESNSSMINLLLSNGFIYCGIITLDYQKENNTRFAYELVL